MEAQTSYLAWAFTRKSKEGMLASTSGLTATDVARLLELVMGSKKKKVNTGEDLLKPEGIDPIDRALEAIHHGR